MLALTTQVLTLTALVAVLVGALMLARARLQAHGDPVVDAIDALLPQTQCAQCGYPGCRPYAEAVAAGAAIDLCPPGGSDTQLALASLLGRSPGDRLPVLMPVKARIDEASCVGCFLCVEACPVDAIVGAPRFMHTVLEDRCTGCELCLPPCPVDCIELVAETPAAEPVPPADASDCIRCNRCEPACPEALPVQHLWWFARHDDLSRAEALGLGDCIECGLCNPECPSGLDLAGTFRAARQKIAVRDRAQAAADLARQHVAERSQRLARQQLLASDRRSRRLAALRARQPG